MIVMGVEDPEGEITYLLGAFPSACGKTNLAMLDPVMKGYKVWTLGDDIAWINVGADGRLYAINPETGFFGVAPGTSDKTNPNMMRTLRNDKFFPTLFTNTGLQTDTNSPWWEGLTEDHRNTCSTGRGNRTSDGSGKNVAHPNSRFTVSIYNCPTLSPEFDNPKGVPISGIIFGGRTIRLPYLWYAKASTGNTAYSRHRPSDRKRPPRPPARQVSSGGTPWPCFPSAATTWPTIFGTG